MSTKILIPIFLILGATGWMLVINLNQSDYAFDVAEVPSLDAQTKSLRLKLKGRIVPGSIQKANLPVKFEIEDEAEKIKVRYVGKDPLPDLFKDHAETQVTGTFAQDGVFEAEHLQAKCASKYEALAPEAEATEPVN